MNKNYYFILGSLLGAAAPACAATLVSLASFGGGDGWRAPSEVITGDTAGTTGTPTAGAYNYLQAGSLERGMAYNPATGNLVLISRSAAGNGIRLLNGATGADVGALNQGTGVISGGTFTTSTVGVSTDGSVFLSNLTANALTSNFKIYQWASEAAAAPTTFFNSAITSTAGTRLGDSLDVFGPAASVSVVAGASGALGYATITSSGATRIETFTPAGPAAGDFRLGITFAGNVNEVWGKQTGGLPFRETTYTGTTGTTIGSPNLTSSGEMAMDYLQINTIPYLATLDANSSIVRVYDLTSPLNPVLLNSATTTSGLLASNGNATGGVKWGAVTGDTAILYAMSTNQGIQAFTFQVPEPSVMMLGLAGVGVLLRRRRN